MKIGRNEQCPCGSGKKYKKCCLVNSEKFDIKNGNSILSSRLKGLIQEGYTYYYNNSTINAVSIWLDAWKVINEIIKDKQINNVNDTIDWNLSGEYIANWFQDIELELGNAGIADNKYLHNRIQVCNEICSTLYKSDPEYLFSFKRAIAESYFHLNLLEKGEECFLQLQKEYPKNVWTYVGWGDMYMQKYPNEEKPNYSRAKSIYLTGKASAENESDVLDQRLQEVENKLAQK